MAVTLQTMAGAVVLAAASGAVVAAYVRNKPNRLLALAKVDLIAYLAAAGGLLTIIPEAVNAFAPELVRGEALQGSVYEHFDRASYVLVCVAFGLGISRRWYTMQYYRTK